MAWSSFMSPVFDRLCQILRALARWSSPVLRALVGFTFSAIGWLKGERSSRSQTEMSEQVVEECQHEGLHETEEWDQGGEEDEAESEQHRINATDEFFCEWDSSWETEEREEEEAESCPSQPATRTSSKFRKFLRSSRDMQNYRQDYPSQKRPKRLCDPSSVGRPNVDFYTGLISSVPDDVYIHEFHENWAKRYEQLERVHSYIQWLFPLPEPGMNWDAPLLTQEEIDDFLNNSQAKGNLLKSYKLMLDFYGIELCDEDTGAVRRAPNWKERFDNLNRHSHNNLRITRILKCLGILGFREYQVPLVEFFLNETLIEGLLPNVQESALNYFLFTVRDKKQRRRLIKFAYLNYNQEDEFVWCPKKLQEIWSAEQRMGGGFEFEQ